MVEEQNSGVETTRQTSAYVVGFVAPQDEEPPFVPQRPTRCGDIGATQRRAHPNDPVYNFDAFRQWSNPPSLVIAIVVSCMH